MNTKDRAHKAVEGQRRQLAHWLAEWRLDSILQKGDEVNLPSAELRNSFSYIYPVVRKVECIAGQIRLLHPSTNRASNLRTIYVLILEAKKESYLVIPFSRFATPATPGEWTTGLRAASLRVLCFWNGRIVSGALLEKSWCVGTLPEKKLASALALHDSLCRNLPVPVVLRKQVGPPVVHPLDPRLKYLEEESGILDVSSMSCAGTKWIVEEDDGALLKAAETKAEYGAKKRRSRK